MLYSWGTIFVYVKFVNRTVKHILLFVMFAYDRVQLPCVSVENVGDMLFKYLFKLLLW